MTEGTEEEDNSVGATIREAMAELDVSMDELKAPPEEFKDLEQDGSESTSINSETEEGQETALQDDEILVAPRSWSAEEKEAFKTFPADAKRALLRRQSDMDRDYHSRSQEIAEREKSISDIEQHIAPLRDDMARNGVTPQVLTQMYKWHKYLSDPKTAARGIAELSTRYGINPAYVQQATSNANRSNGQSEVDKRIAEMQQMLTEQQTYIKQSEQAKQTRTVTEEVNAFRSEVDESGSKRFPLIGEGEALEAPMAEELRLLHQFKPEMPLREKLELSYKKAVALNPDIQAEIANARNARGREDRAARVKQARIAGSSITGSPVSSASNATPERSLREELLANFKKFS